MLRRHGAPKVTRKQALAGISKAAHRGSPWGCGFAVFHAPEHDQGRFKAKVLVEDARALEEVRTHLHQGGIDIVQDNGLVEAERAYSLWEALLKADRLPLLRVIRDLHWSMHEGQRIRARFISLGQYSEVWKGLGWPWELAARYNLTPEGDLWLAHTRQPTNFLGDSIRTHPFHMLDIGFIHNGEDSADGAHAEFLIGHGERSFVGPDSEKMMLVLNHLVTVEGLSVEKAMAVLAPTYERYWDQIVFQDGQSNLRALLYRFRGLQFDGSYAAIAGYTDGNDVFMAGAVAFRPLVMGEDDRAIYLASEASQIKEVSPHATTWPCKPRRRLLASMRQGIIRDGRGEDRTYFYSPTSSVAPTDGEAIGVCGKSPGDLVREVSATTAHTREVTLTGVNGERYLGMHLPTDTLLRIVGLAGDSVGNVTSPDRRIHLVGSGQDDAFDTSQARIIVDGHLGEVPLYAFQGPLALIRGSGASQAMVLMRGELGQEPLVVWGGRLDDAVGEFMASGTAVVLGVDALDSGYTGSLVGDFTMSGAVGRSRLYVRGEVPYHSIGLPPDYHEVIGELEQGIVDSIIDQHALDAAAKTTMTWWELGRVLPLPMMERLQPLFRHRYLRPLEVERRRLHTASDDARAGEGIDAFARQFNLPGVTVRRLLDATYTIVYPSG